MGSNVFGVRVQRRLGQKQVFVLSGLLPLKSRRPATQFFAVLRISAEPAQRFGTRLPLLSSAYMAHPSCNCFRLLMHAIPCALVFTFDKTGRSMAARIAMMAMTTKSSISVNASPDLYPRNPCLPTGLLTQLAPARANPSCFRPLSKLNRSRFGPT